MDLGIELLGRLAELHPPQLRELRLVLFDQELGAGQFGACRGQFGLTFGQQSAKLRYLLGGIDHGSGVYQKTLAPARRKGASESL